MSSCRAAAWPRGEGLTLSLFAADSDILAVRLPNGWSVGLSNQHYLNPHGENLEGVGLAPDVAVGEAYPSDAELREGRDEVLAAAVALLDGGGSKL